MDIIIQTQSNLFTTLLPFQKIKLENRNNFILVIGYYYMLNNIYKYISKTSYLFLSH